MGKFKVDQIDHIEVFVPERYEGAKWYEEHLGFEVMKDMEFWADDPHGPLMTSCDGGNTKIAFFNGEPQANRSTAGFHILAFRVSADGFMEFLNRLEQYPLYDKYGQVLTKDNVADHNSAYSIYFKDTWGHNLEVTTYEYGKLKELLNK